MPLNDVSTTGLSLLISGSVTFPNGFEFSEFADDADPFDIPSVQLAQTAMNINGDLISWTSPQPIVVNLNAIPASDGDQNLAILAEANRAAKGKSVARDVITIVATYPDGSTVTVSNGKMTNAMPGRSTGNDGKAKSQAYVFSFQDIAPTRPTV